ncbi:MAG: OmpA family protein [candidate division Zixibacteria bacterium]|nr:OmpA family protein [candidate division Zixibacteria bacterium]
MPIKRLIILLSVIALVAGCGASKDYVDQQIRDSEARTSAQLGDVEGKASATSLDLQKLQALQSDLESKAEMALNQAKGFENYQIIWEGEVNFDFDSDEITSAAEQTLMDAGQKMETSPESLVELVGHTDNTGSNAYNLALGERRSESVRRFLADRFGISLYRMFTLSYGEDKATAMSDEPNSASRNRRVTVRIWGELN